MFITEEEFRARLVTMEQELVLLREENIKLKSSGKDLAIYFSFRVGDRISKIIVAKSSKVETLIYFLKYYSR